MVEFLLVLTGILLAVTVVAAFEYYKQIRKAQREYEKAREALEDIVLSFNREIKREADRTGLNLIPSRIHGRIEIDDRCSVHRETVGAECTRSRDGGPVGREQRD